MKIDIKSKKIRQLINAKTVFIDNRRIQHRSSPTDNCEVDNWLEYRAEDMAQLVPVSNRNRFDRDLKSLFNQVTQEGGSLSLLMIDIDHFKSVNDSHGHPAADEALKNVGEVLRTTVDQRGHVYRYGGEEFSVILPYLSPDESITIAEEVRYKIENNQCMYNNMKISVTISIGLSRYPDQGISSPEKLMIAADSALYKAKEAGRNRVHVYNSNDECSVQ